MCTALHAGLPMLTFSILTVPHGGQCTCCHVPSTKQLIAHYDCTPPRALHMALHTPRELQVHPQCLLGPEGNDNKPIDDEVPTYGDHVLVTTRRKEANSSAAQKTSANETNERKQRKRGTNDTRKNKTTKAAEISDEERLITDSERNHDKNNTINDDEALDDVLDEDLDLFDMALAYQDDGNGVLIADVPVRLNERRTSRSAVQR